MTQIHYRKDAELTWRLVKRGNGFGFIDEKGKPVSKSATAKLLNLEG